MEVRTAQQTSKDGSRDVLEVILLEVDFGNFFFLGIAYSRLTQ